jgi:hypothetical protein
MLEVAVVDELIIGETLVFGEVDSRMSLFLEFAF